MVVEIKYLTLGLSILALLINIRTIFVMRSTKRNLEAIKALRDRP